MHQVHIVARVSRGTNVLRECTLNRAQNPTKRSLWATNRVRERATQHRGEECPWRGRPDLRGMCHEKWLKSGPTYECDLRFRMVYPEKEGRIVASALFPRESVKTATWNSRVKSPATTKSCHDPSLC